VVGAPGAARRGPPAAAPRREVGVGLSPRLRRRAGGSMKVILRNPRREIEIAGKRRVKELLVELDLLPGTVLVIRGSELLTGDTVVGDDDVLEVRPVMSGGAP